MKTNRIGMFQLYITSTNSVELLVEKKSTFKERFGIAEVLNHEKNFGFYIQIDGQICFEKLQTIKSKWSENQWSELKILK